MLSCITVDVKSVDSEPASEASVEKIDMVASMVELDGSFLVVTEGLSKKLKSSSVKAKSSSKSKFVAAWVASPAALAIDPMFIYPIL